MNKDLRDVNSSIQWALVLSVVALILAAATSLLPTWTIWIVVLLVAITAGILITASRLIMRLIQRTHTDG